jgi:DNA (cytosine-5)-methyltransferase 1
MGADEFVINVPANQALFGFGDAVCVPVIDWLARNYLNHALAEMQQTKWETVLR